ncbi:MAG: HigA family addiction module antidote protein [Anaerolineales bacterium]|nr:HigA family addiction module antidote protein [Anaerolineales bacterium]
MCEVSCWGGCDIYSYQHVIEIVNEKPGITPNTALRLAKFSGNTPGFWMNLQLRFDLCQAQKADSENIKKIRTIASGLTPAHQKVS